MTQANEPAFPMEEKNDNGTVAREWQGLTKREYFISQALSGVLASGYREVDTFAAATAHADETLSALTQAPVQTVKLGEDDNKRIENRSNYIANNYAPHERMHLETAILEFVHSELSRTKVSSINEEMLGALKTIAREQEGGICSMHPNNRCVNACSQCRIYAHGDLARKVILRAELSKTGGAK